VGKSRGGKTLLKEEKQRKDILPPVAKGQENGAKIFLGFKDYKVEEVREGENKIVMKVIAGMKKVICLYCGSTNLYWHGIYKPREILHNWSSGKRVYLELHRHRWRCCDCRRTFNESDELVQPHSKLTRQLDKQNKRQYGSLKTEALIR